MKLLVVEPSEAVRTRLVGRLRDGGFDDIDEADAPADALALAAVRTIDAIVLDIVFPDRHGLALLRALRAGAPGALILILTNATHYRRRCLDGGADHFFDKSSEFDRVLTTLLAALSAAGSGGDPRP